MAGVGFLCGPQDGASEKAAHRFSGRRGDDLRTVRPSSDRQLASVEAAPNQIEIKRDAACHRETPGLRRVDFTFDLF